MRAASGHTFVSFDGTPLYYRCWPTKGSGLRRALILLHRGHEHSARLQEVVDGLELPDYAMFAWDARGHGRSPGERGYAGDCGVLVQDLDAFARHIRESYGYAEEDLAIVAHSLGAVVVAAWLHDFAPDIRCAVLAAPAFRVTRLITIGLLPPALRQAYGFEWDDRRERRFARTLSVIRRVRGTLPARWREWPSSRGH